MKKYLCLLALCAVLTGCQSTSGSDVEMPYSDKPDGYDIERVSPCACIDYTPFINLGQS